ncbi:hypothetical protein W59_24490 [Rhodococcus opacus RKJ300 = JCM 13270]|uniref:Uncharacterized protein n=1 Tax=Rhodococcus opacus RKJ300 = JCM 13270 TaxID=1165867 RepID=I0WLR6_RHOOP|nr:hypothetical protein W59_24490 [Rhodococcus opacus RKJ300 = JCM 13270]
MAFCGNRIWRTDGTHWISWHSKGAIDGHGTFRTHVALHRPAFDEKARLPSPPTIFNAPTGGYPHEPSLLPACSRSGGRKSKLGVRQFEVVRSTLIEDSVNELFGTPRGRVAA